jgi:hypothetical protein
MLSSRTTVQLRPAAVVAVMFLSAMSVSLLVGSSLGAAHHGCALCVLAPSTTARSVAPRFAAAAAQPASSDAMRGRAARSQAEAPAVAAAWKRLDLPPPAR